MPRDDGFTAYLGDLLTEGMRRAGQAEVYGVDASETPVRFEANRLKEVQGRRSSVAAVRLLREGRTGFAMAAGLPDPNVLVDMAMETAPFGAEAKFEFPTRQTYPDVPVFDGEVEAAALERMMDLGEHLISRVRAHTPAVLCDASVTRSAAAVHLLNSSGGEAHYEKTVFVSGVDGVLVSGEDMLFVGDTEVSCHPLFDDAPAEITTWQLEMAKARASVSTGVMPVILTPRAVAGSLVLPLAVGFNGRNVLEGSSPLKGKLGEKLFDSRLTVTDDPVTPFRPESRPCDDEGMPSQRTPLVEGGVVRNFLYDLQTAGLANAHSTGSGSRSRGGLPGPGISCMVVQGGEATFQDMVREVKRGLVVDQLMGAEQGNVLGGDFSGNVLLGFKVEKGEIVGRVKDVMVSGNVYRALGDLVALSKETRLVHGNIVSPYIMLGNLSVAAKVQG